MSLASRLVACILTSIFDMILIGGDFSRLRPRLQLMTSLPSHSFSFSRDFRAGDTNFRYHIRSQTQAKHTYAQSLAAAPALPHVVRLVPNGLTT